MEQDEYRAFEASNEEIAIIEAYRRKAAAEVRQVQRDNPDKGKYGLDLSDIKPFSKPEEKQRWITALRNANADRGK